MLTHMICRGIDMIAERGMAIRELNETYKGQVLALEG